MGQQVYYCVSLRNGNLETVRLEQDAKIKPPLYQQAWDNFKPMQRKTIDAQKVQQRCPVTGHESKLYQD